MRYIEELIKKAQVLKAPSDKVLVISGSPRKGGNSDIVAKQIIEGLESEDIDGAHINLGDINFSGCIGCEKCRKDKVCSRLIDGMTTLYPEIMNSRGLVLISPVHNYNVTSWMKAFIDRMYCFYEFDNKTRPREWSSRLGEQNRKAIAIAICEQKDIHDMGFTLEAMERPMEALGYEIVDSLPVFKSFEKGAVRKQNEIMAKAYELGVKLGKQM
ncbi:flavodoxin family protein [Halosquirtibacter xylanolyticus]|uniref:flavodoxin family protein n=1 Tax=Halosquirtibacter xylanolyticus TaxID=3374599 RepID=UPI0037485E42|nr:flavodoxin family protein [Prolixibacteraceae bacterium]